MATDPEQAKRFLREARTVAVLGASTRPSRPAHYVPAYLVEQGYRVLPVNPMHEGEPLFGQTIKRTLAELPGPVDIVDVFRRSEHLPDHVDDILAMQPWPKVVWLQSGIENDTVARLLEEKGIRVVQDRCTYADHRRFGLPRAGSADDSSSGSAS